MKKRDNKMAAILLIVLMVLLLAFCVYVELQHLSIPMLIVALAALGTIWRQTKRLQVMSQFDDGYSDDDEDYDY